MRSVYNTYFVRVMKIHHSLVLATRWNSIRIGYKLNKVPTV